MENKDFSKKSLELLRIYTGDDENKRSEIIKTNRCCYERCSEELKVNFKDDMRFTGDMIRTEKNIGLIIEILNNFSENKKTVLNFSGFAEGSEQTFFNNGINIILMVKAKNIFGKNISNISKYGFENEIITTCNDLKIESIEFINKQGENKVINKMTDRKFHKLLEIINNKETTLKEKKAFFEKLLEEDRLVVNGTLVPNEKKFKEFFPDLKRQEIKKNKTVEKKKEDLWTFKDGKTKSGKGEEKKKEGLWTFKDGKTKSGKELP